MTDARWLVQYIDRRYAELEGEVPVCFSDSKSFHVAVELIHASPSGVGFQHVISHTLAEGIGDRQRCRARLLRGRIPEAIASSRRRGLNSRIMAGFAA